MEDTNIVDLFLQRNPCAIEHTTEKYGNRLRRVSYGIVQNVETAQECENDTYVQAWNSIPPHQPRDYLYAFLIRIVRHISLNRCRENKRLKRFALVCELSKEMEECIPAPDDCESRLEDLVIEEILNRFLASLPEEKRNLFLRRYWYMDSISSLVKRFGFSESKVKTTLHRLRNQLRQQLIKEGYTL